MTTVDRGPVGYGRMLRKEDRRFVRGRAVEFFGWQIPSPFADLGAAARPIAQSHGLLAHALAIVVGLHVLAALWHHFGKRDNVLKSMLPGAS